MTEIRSMEMRDLPTVLRIIEQHDEDDYEAAESDYHQSGLDNQFVMEIDGKVVGVTGYREVTATDKTAWLSWTYLDEQHRGTGKGKAMISELLEGLRERGCRKVFVKLSDYQDPEDGAIYAQALKTYQSLGFVQELIGYGFYDEDENQLILGLGLQEQVNDDALEIEEEKPAIRFNGLHEIAETEGSYTFNWTVKEKSFFGKRSFSVDDLRLGLETVKERQGRKIFLTFPSNLPLIHAPLQAAGFKYVGKLTDYYESGIDELHFTHDLSNV